MEDLTNDQTVRQLANLAMEAEMNIPVDWNSFGATKEQVFENMATQVLQQMENTPEEQRAVVAMATITKMLVENLVLTMALKGKQENE